MSDTNILARLAKELTTSREVETDGKTIPMLNLTESLKDDNWNIEYRRGYGFTASNRTTTNGSLSFLLRCVHTPENKTAVMQFARDVAKIDEDAARQVAFIDNPAQAKDTHD